MESPAFLLITKLDYYPIIFGHLWIKKHRLLFNIINNSILFSLKYYSYLKVLSVLVSTISTTETKIISIAIQ